MVITTILIFGCDDDNCDGIDTSLIDGCGGGEDDYWLYVGSLKGF